jgi:hypothetical protein
MKSHAMGWMVGIICFAGCFGEEMVPLKDVVLLREERQIRWLAELLREKNGIKRDRLMADMQKAEGAAYAAVLLEFARLRCDAMHLEDIPREKWTEADRSRYGDESTSMLIRDLLRKTKGVSADDIRPYLNLGERLREELVFLVVDSENAKHISWWPVLQPYEIMAKAMEASADKDLNWTHAHARSVLNSSPRSNEERAAALRVILKADPVEAANYASKIVLNRAENTGLRLEAACIVARSSEWSERGGVAELIKCLEWGSLDKPDVVMHKLVWLTGQNWSTDIARYPDYWKKVEEIKAWYEDCITKAKPLIRRELRVWEQAKPKPTEKQPVQTKPEKETPMATP